MIKFNILSLFDGISCGQVALKRAGININNYYASEINEKSIAITQNNHPETVQLGNVRDIDINKLKSMPKIDLIIGGSPCQNLTITVINNQNYNQGLQGNQSKLFYDFVRIYKWIKENNNPFVLFLLENVESMKEQDRDVITKVMQVDPIMIDSALVSAQDRKRYYWTNIDVKEMPEDKGVLLKDIMQENVPEKYYKSYSYDFHGWDKKVCATVHINGHDIIKRVYNPNFKCGTLTRVSGGNHQKKVFDRERVRYLTPIEYERLQTLPDNYTEGFSDTVRWSGCGDGWTVDVISHIFSFIN